jgi:peptidoglycan-N-acetylglucosamine deacetylase
MKPMASLSLDLDNKWSYLRTHGDAEWEALPSYLPTLVPRVLDFLAKRNLKITFFVVGLDAEQPADQPHLRALADAGHEIGCHSHRHEPWLHLYSPTDLEAEFDRAEAAIRAATGVQPKGFRGPGFSLSAEVLQLLARRGYDYDCSTFPSYLGPLARAYYFATAKLAPEERARRAKLFGKFSEGFRPLKPYAWDLPGAALTEIPVTTMPLFKVPIHVSYLLYLAGFSTLAMRAYWRLALGLCRALGVGPSLLLHPLDFLGGDDVQGLDFFPAMKMPGARKLELVGEILDGLSRRYDCMPMAAHAAALKAGGLRSRTPRF